MPKHKFKTALRVIDYILYQPASIHRYKVVSLVFASMNGDSISSIMQNNDFCSYKVALPLS